MTRLSWVYLLMALLPLGYTEEHNHSGETDTYYVSVGHVFLLSCPSTYVQSEVMWSRGDGHDETLPAGVEVRDGLLWFLPVQTSHNGTYICEKRDKTRKSKRRVSVSVSSEYCPDANEDLLVTEGVSGGLPCKQKEIFRLNLMRSVRWMKDCNPMQLDEDSIYADGLLRLPAVTQWDAGKYTCLIDFNIDGRNYTAARSIQLTVKNGTPDVFPELQVVRPQQDVFIVQVGKRAELQCLAYTGFSEDSEIYMYWTIDGKDIKDIKELSESWTFIHNRGKVYGQSNLSISEVAYQFLNVPIQCNILSPVEKKFGLAWLKEADHTDFHVSVALCLMASLLVLFLVLFSFRVEVVLSYRKLMRHFPTQQAIHDAISTTLQQCRRLIIILSPNGKAKKTTPLCENQIQLLYEQEVGLYNALMQNDPKILLVEIDGPVDYSHLPESLRYIRRKQRVLKWKNVFTETNELTTFISKRNFWKNLQYQMPAVPVRRLQSVA
ncbi:interleukin-1 receptor type 1 isoform X2 [Kryptolebias marmoratus]|uniref:interleukin-1 receptor type 1 isoform X2 n=1 Tax=Kryptolebias marmoratus TaxID=37003 RepID=UPI0007F86631|nr:interleukin-1 receptor type 1 isoform X2 [Kryptolebias marmoratus]